VAQGAVSARTAYVPLSFAWGEAFQFDWSEEGLVIGGVWRKVQLAHMKLCASRAFWLVAYPSQGHEMLFDAHTRCLTGLGGVAGRGIYDNMKTAVDRTPRKDRGRIINARFAAMAAHYLFLLREDNTRVGFFEPEQFQAVMGHLPEPLQPVVEFAYITGWRIASEVLPLQWRHVDFAGGEVRLDAGTTKNGEGRMSPLTDDLRGLLEARHDDHKRLKLAGQLCPFVFKRMVAIASISATRRLQHAQRRTRDARRQCRERLFDAVCRSVQR